MIEKKETEKILTNPTGNRLTDSANQIQNDEEDEDDEDSEIRTSIRDKNNK